MKQHQHPGRKIKKIILKKNITASELARRIGVTKQYLADVMNGHKGISVRLAVGLEDSLGDSAETWIIAQAKYDVQKFRIESRIVNG